ncbi:hypothetical protein CO661_14225 [Sinorhizobium fredii]|uniref:Uncharacterized protein n=1 Tax=Rhizobium fredii TaxID=380 RepID=A0A2A6LY67_RHIFR|nr:hypothetical protein [Sinorhizobium fredii]PDT47335.1 hypothetical protein CO661_14225 [Sinorhizobium fredii]
MRFLVFAALLAVSAQAGEPLGPSGLPSAEPFKLTSEYEADFKASTKCKGSPDGATVREGKSAVYVEKSGSVEVLLDEYARRFAIDYCWI